ncbi:unnamed protein product, partial [Scytosiphon promiscuus]
MDSAAAMLSSPGDNIKLGKMIAHHISEWCYMAGFRGGGLGWSFEVLSCLLQYPSVLPPRSFINLSKMRSGEWMKTCILGAIASADNPFVPGIALSVVLAEAADNARAGDRRRLEYLRRKVDALVLEVLERLPSTVQGFDGGMAGCASVLEPEVSREDTKGRCGPLWMALQHRRHVRSFCTKPLVMDFLSLRFTHGLPDLMRRNGVSVIRAIFMATGGTGESMSEEQFYHRSWRRSKEGQRFMDRCLLFDFRDKILCPFGQPTEHRDATILEKFIRNSLLSPCMMLQGASVDTH